MSIEDDMAILGGAEERVGTLITEQVHLIIEDAERQADELRNEANSSAERTRLEATDSARRLLERIQAFERPLAELVRSLNLEIEKVAGQIRIAEGLYASPGPSAEDLRGSPSPDAPPGPSRDAGATAPEQALTENVPSQQEVQASETGEEVVETESAPVSTSVAEQRGYDERPASEDEAGADAESAEDVTAAKSVPADEREPVKEELAPHEDFPVGQGAEREAPSTDDAVADSPGPTQEKDELAAVERPIVEQVPAAEEGEPPTDRFAEKSASGPTVNGAESAMNSAGAEVGEARVAKKRGRLRDRLRRGGGGPFITEEGQCAVCQKSFRAGTREELELSAWSVTEDVGLCPDCAEKGWQLPEGSRRPFRRGRGS